MSHIDHIKPLSKGGKHSWENIQMVCKVCNIGKNDQHERDFLDWAKRVAGKTGI